METRAVNLHDKPTGYFQSQRSEMLKYIPKNVKTTLEFGCGFGGFSSLLKENFGAETWAVEIDKEAADKASAKLYKVINADAVGSLIEIPENYFDCIIFFDVLEHLVDPYSLLCLVKKKLAEQGVIIASIPNVRYYRALVDLVVHGNWDYKDHGILDNTHLRFFTYKSITKMCRRLNFEILKLEGIHPTSSRTFRLLNLILLNALSDIKYKHFAVVIRPKPSGK